MTPSRRPSATAIAAALVVGGYAVLGWQHRWMFDDGMIVARAVRQILAGNGPNYNALQRDEVDTSVLWTWFGAAAAAIVHTDVALDLLVLGLLLAITGLGLALAASARFHRGRGEAGFLAPAGALVFLGIAVFWDFATSGLETGLSLCWLGLIGWLLNTITERTSPARLRWACVVLGLGPLVRPDFALVTVVFGVAVLWMARSGPRRALGCVASAAALPVGYQIFRAGYYGILVPMPALAKEAGGVRWASGLRYFTDFYSTYTLVVPHALCCVLVVTIVVGGPLDRTARARLAAPLIAGTLMGIYILRVGGDYVHGRMWLPVVFTLLLPMMVMPVGRRHRPATVGVALLAVWALLSGLYARTPYQGTQLGPHQMVNARAFQSAVVAEPHPTSSAALLRIKNLGPRIAQLTPAGRRVLIMGHVNDPYVDLWTFPLAPGARESGAFFFSVMGLAGVLVPLDTTVIDEQGLVTPLAGHLRLDRRGRPGHEKVLPQAWVLAQYADPAAVAALPDGPGVTREEVRAAGHALSCGALKELMDSVNEPMSRSRFWANLRGSIARTGLRVPADPLEAEREFCGPSG